MNLQIGFLCEIKNVSRIKFDIQFGLTADMRAKCATNHPQPPLRGWLVLRWRIDEAD